MATENIPEGDCRSVLSNDKPTPTHASAYHIYHQGESHFVITPVRNSEKRKALHEKSSKSPDEPSEDTQMHQILDDEAGFFVHTPYLSFHHPPRTLRRGTSKHGPTLCLIHDSWLWRRWKLQFGDNLASAIDARGVVSGVQGSNVKGDNALKGYKVRSWRLLGESGKQYHREVNAKRKETLQGESSSTGLGDSESVIADIPVLPEAEEVVYLDWKSPISKDARCYHFQYAGVDFYWKGMGAVVEGSSRGIFLRYNHLKLVVEVPLAQPAKEETPNKNNAACREFCLGKYYSSLSDKKAGRLELFDSTIYHFLQEHIFSKGKAMPALTECVELGGIDSVRRLRLYDLMLATAMCMVIGEWEKRKWVKGIVMGVAFSGAADGIEYS
jgi:hypothetical protein